MAWTRFHPLTRITIVLALVLALASLAGWERVGNALANFSPGGTFETRCAELPSSEVEVELKPLVVRENRNEPFEALARMTRDRSLQHRTIGVTQANFGHRSTVDMKGVEDRYNHRACVRPRVRVELFVQPLIVYVASEYATDPCRARVIREHEDRHVQVFATFARESAGQLATDLARVIGRGPHFGMTLEDAQHGVDRRIGDALATFMREAERTLSERQASVDTPDEYQRVGAACTG
ncbi:MAG TPA: hypothetical protein VNG69_16120 [Casimicrobiaceae bacterium]|nr:hypothetical protein [Casimicrobiaceae bacterium]